MAACWTTLELRAQQKQVPAIQLRNETLYPLANTQQWIDSMNRKGWSDGPQQVIVQFSSIPDATGRKQLEEHGFSLKEYIGNNAFMAVISKASLTDDLKIFPFAILTVRAADKIIYPDLPSGSNSVDVIISCLPGITEQEIQGKIKQAGGKLLTSPLSAQHCYEAQVPADKLKSLAAWYGIKSIGAAAHDQPLNFESNGATKNNIAQLPSISGGYGLLGDSIAIGVGDNTSGMNHADLRDRIINYNPAPYTNHGMHINGITGGAGNIDPKARGFAPHATLIDHLYNLVWARTGTMVQDHNMSVTNNSYAAVVGNCAYEGVYDAYSQALDTLCLQYPNVLHVFASGNDGSITCPPYVPGFGTVTGSYQPAKNILVVSQTDKRYVWGNNSSRGPVRDGRLKPEITAIGTEVLSTRGVDIYLISGGTSMASPQVAGAGALLQQRYKQTHSGAYPPSDLVKLLLMNGAMDIGNTGPDYTFGFGMMDTYRSLQMMENNRYTRNSITNGVQQNTSITVPANTGQLKVMIYWHDAPASILSATQLVNDLDLEVVDPSNNIIQPFILNPAPGNVNDLAVRGADHLNNVEQVVIDDPAAGNYTIRVKGTTVPSGPQSYVIAYDFIPTGVQLTFPTTGAVARLNDSLRVYWDASPDTAKTFTLEFSDNNGSSWTTIDNNISGRRRQYAWLPTGINSSQCLMRMSRNTTTQQFTTGAFTINLQPQVQLSNVQCPGYIAINWNPVSNATSYTILRKKGPYMQTEAVGITDTTYTLRGLSLDSTYYVAVQPVINGVAGFRSIAVIRTPNSGSCTGNISDGDLMAERVESPVSGRQFTASQLGNSLPISLRLRNLDDVSATSYRVSYSLNNGPWQSQAMAVNIPANTSQVVTVPATLNLAALGTYNLRVAVTNLAAADNIKGNDTISVNIRHLANAPVNLAAGFTDDFESSGIATVAKDSLGITPNEHWDFYNSSDTGRLRTFVNSDITISGNRSVSMDVRQFVAPAIVNMFTGTFNAGAYSTAANEVRLDFDYKIHGTPNSADSNRVWVRGSDTQPWLPLFTYDRSASPGAVKHSGTLSLTDVLIAGTQNFSSSTQLRFGQRDTTVIALNNYGSGVTLDNVKLFTVQNDVALDSMLTPVGAACNLSSSPVKIRVYNGVTQTLNNVQVSYSFDNGPAVNEVIASLPGKTSLIYTFSQILNIPTPGAHNLKVWVTAAGDTYHNNDTLSSLIRNEPLITSYPYLENFENGDGFWYSEGRNSSWQFGTPATRNVRNAASGTKAWKTNLIGSYNDNELSYLYSPCFDIAGLTTPMLSFSAVMDIENCGTTLCDAGWMEYSTDGGSSWTKLGNYNQGYAWYTDSARRIWNNQGDYRWHVTSIPLPVTTQPLRLRYVLATDPGTGADGLSIDDIHIFNYDYAIHSAGDAGPITQSVSGAQFVNFLQGSRIVAQIRPDGQTLGNTDVNVYIHPVVDTASLQYYLQRSFMVNTAQVPADSVTARLYVLDSEVDSMVNARGCLVCSKPADVYRLGISKYDDSIQSNENGVLSDNVSGTWTFIPRSKVRWVPYDNGYYAEVRLRSFSELWFNDGGPSGNLSLPNFGLSRNELVAVYPNPNTDGQVRLTWTAGLARSIDLKLTNTVGQIVMERSLASTNGKNNAVLNIGSIPKGIYYLHCMIGDRRYVQKIIFR